MGKIFNRAARSQTHKKVNTKEARKVKEILNGMVFDFYGISGGIMGKEMGRVALD